MNRGPSWMALLAVLVAGLLLMAVSMIEALPRYWPWIVSLTVYAMAVGYHAGRGK